MTGLAQEQLAAPEAIAEQLLILQGDSKGKARMFRLIRFSGLILQGPFLKEAGGGSVRLKCLISL